MLFSSGGRGSPGRCGEMKLQLRVRSVGLALVVATGLAIFFVGASGAVVTGSPSGFESNDGNMTVEGLSAADWNCFAGHDGFQPAAGINVGTGTCSPNLVYANASTTTDPAATTADDSWVNGQKMDQQCALVEQNKNQQKNDFTNIASYNETAGNGDLYLYGGTIRVAANGDASQNVELNQVAGTAACPINRTAGDKLLAFNYLNGGTSLQLQVLTFIDAAHPTLGGNNGTCIVAQDSMPCWGA